MGDNHRLHGLFSQINTDFSPSICLDSTSIVAIFLFMETEKDLTYQIIGAAYNVHSVLGPGLLENAYKECLFYELDKIGLVVEKEKTLPLVYKSIRMEAGYRLDLLVENRIVVEIKSIDVFADIHLAQVLTYLKLSGCKTGLLLNFNVADMKKGIKRVVR